jgi:hypothetical protein
LTRALDELTYYDDPDPGVYECREPTQETLFRAQCALQIEELHRLLQQESESPSPSQEDRVATTFPTPEGASWSDVVIKKIDGHSVSIRIGQIVRQCTFWELGMVDNRNKTPNVQWDLLLILAAHDGVLTWRKPGASRKVPKRKEILAKSLKAFFQLDGDPIVLTDDEQGYRTVFTISEG